MIKALVVDDEVIIAEDLAHQLKSRDNWDADFFVDPTIVMAAIEASAYDVCFLDIEMPECNGIMLGRLIREKYPEISIIFSTAFAEHAATAYRLSATDYLVKPINGGVLDEACVRVEKEIAIKQSTVVNIEPNSSSRVIVVKSVGRTDYVKTSDIVMGQAAGNYVRLYSDDKEYLHRCSFTTFADQLVPEGFVRCHRSFIVNTNKVVSFIRNKDGGDELVLENGIKAPVSEGYKKSLDKVLATAALAR